MLWGITLFHVPNLNEMITPYFPCEPKSCLKVSGHNDGRIIEAEGYMAHKRKTNKHSLTVILTQSALILLFLYNLSLTSSHNTYS